MHGLSVTVVLFSVDCRSTVLVSVQCCYKPIQYSDDPNYHGKIRLKRNCITQSKLIRVGFGMICIEIMQLNGNGLKPTDKINLF